MEETRAYITAFIFWLFLGSTITWIHFSLSIPFDTIPFLGSSRSLTVMYPDWFPRGTTFEKTDEDRAYFLIDIPCHPDFVEEDLSNVVSYVDTLNNEQLKQKMSYVVSYVMSYVDGANLEYIFKVFVALQKETSLTELVAMYGQTNRSRFKRTTIDILIQTGLATPTILDKPKSRNQKYVLTEAGRKLIKDCAAK
ncbi:MAG: hypothetical protein J6Y98_06375 [Bacteroidales bacterium]|nr:hypothetical protein [Bacteroidales bacterium]